MERISTPRCGTRRPGTPPTPRQFTSTSCTQFDTHWKYSLPSCSSQIESNCPSFTLKLKGRCSSHPWWLHFKKIPSFFHMLPGAALEGRHLGVGMLYTKYSAPAAGFCGCLLLAIETRDWGWIYPGKNPKLVVLPRWAGSAAHRASCSCPCQCSVPDALLGLPQEPGQVQSHCACCLHLFRLAKRVWPLIGAYITIMSTHYLLVLTDQCLQMTI